MAKTGVIFGGPSPEHDISILTGLQVVRRLTPTRDVVALYWSKTGDWYSVPTTLEAGDFLEGVPRGASFVHLTAGAEGGFLVPKKGPLGKSGMFDVDVAVNCCHGAPGEDGSLQGCLDLAGITYTGPTSTAAAFGMDKLAFHGAMSAAGLPALGRSLLNDETKDLGFSGPYLVKPRFGGSSIGIEIVDSLETARDLLKSSPHLRSGAVIESYRPQSFDLNVAVRLWPEPQLSAIEKPIRSPGDRSHILGYADKYLGGEGMVSAPRELPATLEAKQEQDLREMAFEVAKICNVRGIQRIDFLSDGGELFVNEINTIPGSLAKYLWVDPIVDFGDLLEAMIEEAKCRPSANWTTSGADGSALRSAGSIAGKLA